MKTHDREIMIYYNDQSPRDKRTIAHALSISEHVKVFTHDKVPSSSTSWKMILDALDVHPKKLLNKSHPEYQSLIKGKEFDDEGWVNVISKNPQLIKAPIAVRGMKAVLCEQPTDIYKL